MCNNRNGIAAPNGIFCYCLPGTDGDYCEKNITDWTTKKNTSQSSDFGTWSVASYAVDATYKRACLTKIDRYPWWRVHLGVILEVMAMQVIPYIAIQWGYRKFTSSWRVLVGVTSTGIYNLCDDNNERQDCKGAVGYLVVIVKRSSSSELTYLGLREVVVYGTLISASPCLSNPCGNGGNCEPKDTYFYMCVCPPAWPGRNCEGKNWARGKTAKISGPNDTVTEASNTVDGNRDDVMMRGNKIDHQCVTTTPDVTSPWWKVELETTIEVTQVFMVTRVESRNTDLLHCDICVGPHNGTYTKYYDNSRDQITGTYTKYIDHSRDTNTTNKFSGLEHYAWFYVWCFPVSIGSAVEIKYTYNHTLFESSFYAILSLCEVEVYGRVRPCASNESHGEYIPPCMSNPCDNGGSCMENDTSYTCLCPAAWTGINCEQKKEEKKLSTTTKLLIGGGVVAVGAGSAVAVAACCSSISCGEVVSKCLGVVALKAIRQ